MEVETLGHYRIVDRIGEGGMGVVYKALEQGGRSVFAGHTPDSFKGYTEDHVQLLVRYMFQFTADEQRRLVPTLPVTAGPLEQCAAVSPLAVS